ncbi:MerR family transcriptional regulator [candidate division KSB1 bacterium]|nr:MerR family transcriptional regulator [candidate division KSB1 bacterium]
MKEKILTEKDVQGQVSIKPELFQEVLKRNLIRAKGTADGNVLIFGAEIVNRVKEIQQFLGMGYSLDEIEKISKKIGLPSAKKQKEKSKKIHYWTVGELASRLKINARTIKYWEERGIIEPDTRSEGGFRLYGEHWIYLCNLIKDLQLFGYSLEEIKEISDLFRDFLAIQGSIKTFSKQDTNLKIAKMKEQIASFFQKMNELKEGVNRWEELLKKKEKDVRQFENKLKQLETSKKGKEKKSE